MLRPTVRKNRSYNRDYWRGARAVEWAGLENRCTGNRTEGSNPSLSAVQIGATWREAVQETPFSTGFFAFLDVVRFALTTPPSVQSGARSSVCDARRMAPFWAPDGTIVGTFFAQLGTTVGTSDGPQISRSCSVEHWRLEPNRIG